MRPAVRLTVVVLAVLVAGTSLLVGARLLLYSDSAPAFDGGPFATTGVVVNPPAPRPGGLQRGDVVQAVDGRSLDDLLRAGPFPDSPQPGDELSYRVSRDGQVRDVRVTLGRFPVHDALARNGAILLLFALAAAMGVYVFARRPEEPAAPPLAIFGVALLAAMVNATFAWEVADIAFRPWLFWMSRVMAGLSFAFLVASLAHFALVFPKPLRLDRRSWVLAAVYGLTLLVPTVIGEGSAVLGRASLASLRAEYQVGGLAFLLAVGAVVVLVLNLWRSRSDGVARRKALLVGLGLVATVSLNVLGQVVIPAVTGRQLPEVYIVVAFLALPLAVAVAVMSRNLFDLDLIINRSLVYGALTAIVVGSYCGAVALADALLRRSAGLALSVPLTAAIAMSFAPLKERMQRAVDVAMYGQRRDPYRVLAALGERLDAAADARLLLATATQTIAEALRLPYVAIVLAEDPRASPAASAGARQDDIAAIPLSHQGEALGWLVVTPRKGESLSVRDRDLLEDLARPVAVAAHALRLSEALRRSHEQLVTATEEERRRIRHDLHDGLGPRLAGASFPPRGGDRPRTARSPCRDSNRA